MTIVLREVLAARRPTRSSPASGLTTCGSPATTRRSSPGMARALQQRAPVRPLLPPAVRGRPGRRRDRWRLHRRGVARSRSVTPPWSQRTAGPRLRQLWRSWGGRVSSRARRRRAHASRPPRKRPGCEKAGFTMARETDDTDEGNVMRVKEWELAVQGLRRTLSPTVLRGSRSVDP